MRKILFNTDGAAGGGAGGAAPSPVPPASPAPPTTAQLEARLAAAEKRLAETPASDPAERTKLLERIEKLEKARDASASPTPPPLSWFQRLLNCTDFTR